MSMSPELYANLVAVLRPQQMAAVRRAVAALAGVEGPLLAEQSVYPGNTNGEYAGVFDKRPGDEGFIRPPEAIEDIWAKAGL